MLCASICACGKEQTDANVDNTSVETDNKDEVSSVGTDAKPNEDYFIWDDNNYITGLTDEGSKQSTLVIPARCEGIDSIYNSPNLQYITFEDDDNVELTGSFSGASSLVSIELPENLENIGLDCFSNCDQLKEISIPSKVENVEKGAFQSCDNLVSVVFEGTNLKSIGKRSFAGCELITEIIIPEGVVTIGEQAFNDCSSLNKLSLPDSLRDIGRSAFANTQISEIHFPENIDLTNMDATAFGINTYNMTVYIVKDSWCDKNQDIWNPDELFGEIKYE